MQLTEEEIVQRVMGAVMGVIIDEAVGDVMLGRHKWPRGGRFYVHERGDLCSEYRYDRGLLC